MTTAADLVDRFEATRPCRRPPAVAQVTAVETMFTIEQAGSSWASPAAGRSRPPPAAGRPVGQQLLHHLRFSTPTDGVIDDALVRDALASPPPTPTTLMPPLRHCGGRQPFLGDPRRPTGEPAGRGRRSHRGADRQTWATSIAAPQRGGVSAIAAALAATVPRRRLIGQLDELAAVLDAPAAFVSAGLFTALALAIHGDVAGARRGAVRATEASGVIRVGHLSPAAAVVEAWSRPESESATAVADAAAAMDEIDAGPTRIAATMLRGLLAELRWRTGDPDSAREDLLRALADVDERGERFWLPELLRLQAELPATEDRPPPRRAAPSPTPRASLAGTGPGGRSGSPADRPTTHRAVRHLRNSAPCE
jgi:hypothetical protein